MLQNPSKLVTHKRLRHPEGPRREWKCPDCNFIVSRNEFYLNFQIFLAEVIPDVTLVRIRKNEKLFKFCKRATEPSLKIGIRSHLETHAQTKKYQCEYCDKQFRFKVGWEGHMNAHRGIYPFECKPCNKLILILKRPLSEVNSH